MSFINKLKNNEASWSIIIKAWAEVVNDKKTKTADIKKLLPLLDAYTKAKYSKVNTLAKKFTELRSPIKDRFGTDSQIATDSDRLMGLGQEASKARNKAIKDKSEDKAKNRGLAEQYDVKDIYDVIDKCAVSKKWELQLALVCLCVGSRVIEVLKISDYKLSETSGNIVVSKVAKRRKDDTEDKTIDKPVIRVKPQQILDAYEMVRKNIPDITGKTNEQIASLLDARINRKVRGLFKIDTKAHTLRYIYANLSFQLYGIPLKIPETFWVQKVLSHTDASTSLTYQAVWVKIENIAKIPQDIKIKLAEVDNDNTNIREAIQELKQEIEEIKEEAPTRNMKRDKSSVPELVEVIRQRVADEKPITVRALKALKYGTATVMEALKIYKASPTITSGLKTQQKLKIIEVVEPVVETRRRSTRTYRPNNLA